jgi:hypothetical protein
MVWAESGDVVVLEAIEANSKKIYRYLAGLAGWLELDPRPDVPFLLAGDAAPPILVDLGCL